MWIIKVARQARGQSAAARQAKEPSAVARVHSSLSGEGTQIFKIEKKISKRIIPENLFNDLSRVCIYILFPMYTNI